MFLCLFFICLITYQSYEISSKKMKITFFKMTTQVFCKYDSSSAWNIKRMYKEYIHNIQHIHKWTHKRGRNYRINTHVSRNWLIKLQGKKSKFWKNLTRTSPPSFGKGQKMYGDRESAFKLRIWFSSSGDYTISKWIAFRNFLSRSLWNIEMDTRTTWFSYLK